MAYSRSNIFYFLQGWYRWIFYPLVRTHIKEQYRYRKSKAAECLDNRSCLACGCTTPQLFLASKSCRKDVYEGKPKCYPEMYSKNEWDTFVAVNNIPYKEYGLIEDITEFEHGVE